MPKYNYIEIDSSGSIVQGTMEAGTSRYDEK